MRAILVLVSLGLIVYGVLVLLITLGFATQVDPALTGPAWWAAVRAKLSGNLVVGLIMGAVGLLLGIGLFVYARFFAGEAPHDRP